ncbi:MAG: ribosome biogenesis GTP-binding protein YihA/YsxC [Candidatus Cloacimonetes bacterium]|nr:ribosome biogenesis GTP-binding protein YihA/YsxC [Candidatus Cloacimonadota bacterium]
MRITESTFETSAVKPVHYPPELWAEIAFAGRSNVGKSSMINTLLGRKLLAKISGKPGKTRLINFFEIGFKTLAEKEPGKFRIVDLPGYGYAKVSKTERASWQKMIGAYFSGRNALRGVVLLIDIRHKADPKDIVMLEMLRAHRCNLLIAATKADKLAQNKIPGAIAKLSKELKLTEDEQMIAFSSLKKTGIDNVLNWIGENVVTWNF